MMYKDWYTMHQRGAVDDSTSKQIPCPSGITESSLRLATDDTSTMRLSLVAFIALAICYSCEAQQFGVPDEDDATEDIEIDITGTIPVDTPTLHDSPDVKGSAKWIMAKIQLYQDPNSPITEAQAIGIKDVIRKLPKQGDYRQLRQAAQPAIDEHRKHLSSSQIIAAMAQAINSIKDVKSLLSAASNDFARRQLILQRLVKEKAIPPEKESELWNDLVALEEYVRTESEKKILALAVADGYIVEEKKTEKSKQEESASNKPSQDNDEQPKMQEAKLSIEVAQRLRKYSDSTDNVAQDIADLAALLYSIQHEDSRRPLRVRAESDGVERMRSELGEPGSGEDEEDYYAKTVIPHMMQAMKGSVAVNELLDRTPNGDPAVMKSIVQALAQKGMIPNDQIDAMSSNINLLKDHVKTTSLFSLMSLAMLGGYLHVDPQNAMRKLEDVEDSGSQALRDQIIKDALGDLDLDSMMEGL